MTESQHYSLLSDSDFSATLQEMHKSYDAHKPLHLTIGRARLSLVADYNWAKSVISGNKDRRPISMAQAFLRKREYLAIKSLLTFHLFKVLSDDELLQLIMCADKRSL